MLVCVESSGSESLVEGLEGFGFAVDGRSSLECIDELEPWHAAVFEVFEPLGCCSSCICEHAEVEFDVMTDDGVAL